MRAIALAAAGAALLSSVSAVPHADNTENQVIRRDGWAEWFKSSGVPSPATTSCDDANKSMPPPPKKTSMLCNGDDCKPYPPKPTGPCDDPECKNLYPPKSSGAPCDGPDCNKPYPPPPKTSPPCDDDDNDNAYKTVKPHPSPVPPPKPTAPTKPVASSSPDKLSIYCDEDEDDCKQTVKQIYTTLTYKVIAAKPTEPADKGSATTTVIKGAVEYVTVKKSAVEYVTVKKAAPTSTICDDDDDVVDAAKPKTPVMTVSAGWCGDDGWCGPLWDIKPDVCDVEVVTSYGSPVWTPCPAPIASTSKPVSAPSTKVDVWAVWSTLSASSRSSAPATTSKPAYSTMPCPTTTSTPCPDSMKAVYSTICNGPGCPPVKAVYSTVCDGPDCPPIKPAYSTLPGWDNWSPSKPVYSTVPCPETTISSPVKPAYSTACNGADCSPAKPMYSTVCNGPDCPPVKPAYSTICNGPDCAAVKPVYSTMQGWDNWVPSKPAVTTPAPAPTKSAVVPWTSAPKVPAKSNKFTTNGDSWGMTYGIYTGDSQCKSYEQVDSDIAQIATKGFSTVRVYSTDCDTLKKVGDACKKYGLKIILGVYIKDNSFVDADNQIKKIIEWACWDLVELIVIGNEAVFNGYCTADELAAYIKKSSDCLKAAGYCGSVTTTEPLNIWQDQGSKFCGAIDVVAGNLIAFFNAETPANKAGDLISAQVKILDNICPGKDSYVMECGWPSAGSCNGQACPSPANQKTALQSVKDTCGEKIIFFSFEDEAWKPAGDFGVEQHWGCMDAF